MAAATDTGRSTPLVVAVTGGIASGKSALTAAFGALGVPVADADIAAREVIAAGSSGLAEVVEAFGPDVLAADGALDRRAMRARVFAHPDARRRLEAIIHPRVRQWLRDAVDSWTTMYGLLAIPLLVESGDAYSWVDRVLVVDVPAPLQIERLMRRDGIDRTLAESMLAAQATREQRLVIADDVHDAAAPLEALPERAARLHRHYLELAGAKQAGELAPSRWQRLLAGQDQA
ncbi:dephospho-CoA kinase [Pseudofulvimonas gallinarii]|jgi:dephospho-CoA kinase|uniref:Dephospho-CoA kinase n=1 Tax=Pseudofulvimonas gallinarii TaxID=634155 RepID=A0A4S3L016_9GAMM|nr:dephospho-CoA kinase [Pseudofulvimonas gallinarii]TCS93706.1 dephospho-CoA kinase [Pseudofulvimonas gallinarii]THD14248.1 dephospho-CoA kinase [Pseudofulvimonas gallinarii]